jgi:hypothetical protein
MASDEPKKACGNCAHYVRTDITKGDCTAHPPQCTFVIVPGQGVMKLSAYPEVKLDGVPCGEHAPKE